MGTALLRRYVVCGLVVTVGVGLSTAQERGSAARLTLEGIAQDPAAWIGAPPTQVRWSEDSESIYFMWNPEAADLPELYVVPRGGGTPTKVPPDRRRFVPAVAGERDRAGTRKVYVAGGDIFVAGADGTSRQMTDTEATERNPRFTFDGPAVTFERGQNLFEAALEGGRVRQVTNFQAGPDPDADPEGTPLQEYLEQQQRDLFDYVRKTERLEAERKTREKAERGARPDPVYLQEGERVSELELSPDGRWVTFILADRSDARDGQVVEMPKYVTESGFVEMQTLSRETGAGRVKAGEPVMHYRLGAVDLTDGTVTWIDQGQGERAVNVNAPVWSPDGRRAVVWAGAVDHKDAWLLLLDLTTGASRTIVHERDDAWVRGFRAGRLSRGDGIAYGWMPDSERVYFLSERDGDYHLYVTDVDGGATTQLTRGAFELTDLRMSADRTRWHFISNEVHPGEHQLYSMPLEGGARTRLTQNSGWYTYVLSPDERHVALTYSNQTSPGDLFVMESQSNFEVSAEPTQLTDSIKEEFRRHAWQANEIVTFDDGEGHTIYADLFVPDRVHPARPAVIYVHGAGWAQGVSRRWSGMRPFLHYLVQEGYIVMSVDYRGSRGYGRDFRTGIYRHMGETEIKSGLAAVEYLVRELNVDQSRIGLFGGSYGGFYTLMAMFKHPGVFAAGAVRAPVTDWAHYNHGYTTRILNSPYNDTMAYERSSPIYFADGLQDHLLIQHGVQDDNVHFQDSVRLAQRLLELKKENWEIMIYPIEAHSLRGEEYDRLDVMRRRVKLFDRVLKATRTETGTTPSRQ